MSDDDDVDDAMMVTSNYTVISMRTTMAPATFGRADRLPRRTPMIRVMTGRNDRAVRSRRRSCMQNGSKGCKRDRVY